MRDNRLARLRARLGERGVRATFAKAFGDHVFRQSESVIIEGDPNEMRKSVFSQALPGLRFAILAPGDTLPPLCPFLAGRERDFAAMLADGKQAMVVLRDDAIVGTVWMALTDHREAAAREHYPVAPGEAYLYCFLLDPAEKPRGTGLALVRYSASAMVGLGITRHFSVVDRANRASYLILHHFAGRECGVRVRHFYILGTRWTRMSRYAGKLGLNQAGQQTRRR